MLPHCSWLMTPAAFHRWTWNWGNRYLDDQASRGGSEKPGKWSSSCLPRSWVSVNGWFPLAPVSLLVANRVSSSGVSLVGINGCVCREERSDEKGKATDDTGGLLIMREKKITNNFYMPWFPIIIQERHHQHLARYLIFQIGLTLYWWDNGLFIPKIRNTVYNSFFSFWSASLFPLLSASQLVLKKIHGSKMSSYFLSTNELDKISMIFLKKIFLLSVRNTEFSKSHQGTINAAIYWENSTLCLSASCYVPSFQGIYCIISLAVMAGSGVIGLFWYFLHSLRYFNHSWLYRWMSLRTQESSGCPVLPFSSQHLEGIVWASTAVCGIWMVTWIRALCPQSEENCLPG